METKKFKSFERVIVKSQIGDYWTCDLYSHLNEDSGTHETINRIDLYDNDILPYEGNEELVGTTDEPETEVRLEEGEWVMMCDNLDCPIEAWELHRFNGFKEYYGFESVDSYDNKLFWQYAVKFSDFNPNDMEKTKKHILCAKGGKVVKYKD